LQWQPCRSREKGSSSRSDSQGEFLVDWQPLSVRKGVRELDGPYEGVPEHLQGTLIPWLEAVLDGGRQRGLMREIISYTLHRSHTAKMYPTPSNACSHPA
jgi:hypothetical protein